MSSSVPLHRVRARYRVGGVPATKRSEYRIWQCMVARCKNPRIPCWKRYGGRGISVCDRWATSFASFVEDVGPRPSAAHSLDRINNDGNYEPGNCRWATRKAQSRNMSANRLVTAFGETRCVADWAQRYGLHWQTLASRLDAGIATEISIGTPAGRLRKRQPRTRRVLVSRNFERARASRFLGVVRDGASWRARFQTGGVRRQLGTFATEEAAAHAYDAAAIEAFGPAARLNFTGGSR